MDITEAAENYIRCHARTAVESCDGACYECPFAIDDYEMIKAFDKVREANLVNEI